MNLITAYLILLKYLTYAFNVILCSQCLVTNLMPRFTVIIFVFYFHVREIFFSFIRGGPDPLRYIYNTWKIILISFSECNRFIYVTKKPDEYGKNEIRTHLWSDRLDAVHHIGHSFTTWVPINHYCRIIVIDEIDKNVNYMLWKSI